MRNYRKCNFSSKTPDTSNEVQTQEQSVLYTEPKDSGIRQKNSTSLLTNEGPHGTQHNDIWNVTYKPKLISLQTQHESNNTNNFPKPFILPIELTTNKPTFHYITKTPEAIENHPVRISVRKSAKTANFNEDRDESPSSSNLLAKLSPTTVKVRNIVPTTYSPPKFFLKSILPKSSASHTVPLYSVRPSNKSDTLNTSKTIGNTPNKSWKALKAVRKLINPVSVNHDLTSSIQTSYDSAERIADSLPSQSDSWNLERLVPLDEEQDRTEPIYDFVSSNTEKLPVNITTSKYFNDLNNTKQSSTISSKIEHASVVYNKPLTNQYISKQIQTHIDQERSKYYPDSNLKNTSSEKQHPFRATVEVPPPHQLSAVKVENFKPEPDQPPMFKVKPKLLIRNDTSLPSNITKPNSTQIPSTPTRISRVNAAIKSLIAIGGSRRTNSKCLENQKCSNDSKQRYLSSSFLNCNLLHDYT